jgi:hypothetical protein
MKIEKTEDGYLLTDDGASCLLCSSGAGGVEAWACAAIEQLETENEALRKDAERYRWLRDPQSDVALVIDKRVGPAFWDYEYRAGGELDEAIDAARGVKGKTK